VPIERWQAILQKATERGAFIGIDPKKFPTDIGSFIRYYEDLKRYIPDGFDLTNSLSLSEFKELYTRIKGNIQ